MTLQGNDLQAAMDAANATLRAIATGEATGDAAIGEYFVTVAEQIAAGVRSFDDVGALYTWRYDVMNAEKARRGRETTDMPSGNSLSAQLTKARTIAQLGRYETARTGTIAVLRGVGAYAGCAWKYAPLVVASRAIAEKLDADAKATDEMLRDAAIEAIDDMPVKTKTTAGEIAKLAKAFDKLRADATHGAVINAACASPDTDADIEKLSEELSLLLNAVIAHEAKAGGKRKA